MSPLVVTCVAIACVLIGLAIFLFPREPVRGPHKIHEHSISCFGVEDPGVYDGVLYWLCRDGELRNPWDESYQRDPSNALIRQRWMAAEYQIQQVRAIFVTGEGYRP